MKYYQNVERPILPPVDLGIMQKTYDTLEQGHLKGVELASKLRSAIAQLPLNESEQAYKDELASGIEQVITENSFAGNAYYAIPDLIKAQGDIDANPVLKNKITAQADYKAYQDMIDSNKELSADAKEYYKEMNPYRNGQKEDGTYDTTFKWQPSSFPTKVYDINDFIEQGIRRAAEEYTDYNSTVWLDANGNITRDPMKALDGQVYYTVGGQKVVLSKDKIIDAINTVINATPGGNESIQQDYNVYKWKYDKNKNLNPNEVLVSPITDNNGEILTPEEFKQKLISEAASQAAYTKGSPKTTYGQGLASFKKYKAAQEAQDRIINNPYGYGNYLRYGNYRENVNSPGNIIVEKNIGKDAIDTKGKLEQEINDTFNFIYQNNNKINKNGSIKDKVETVINDPNVSQSEKNTLKNYYNAYEETLLNIEAFKENLNSKDKEKFDFGSAITNPGATLDIKRSKYDKKAMNYYNDLFGDKQTVEVFLTTDQMNHLKNNYKSSFDDKLYIDNGQSVILNKSTAHSDLMRACKEIDNAFRATRSKWYQGGDLTSAAPTLVKQELNNLVITNNPFGLTNTSAVGNISGFHYSSSPIKKLADLYGDAVNYSKIDSDIVQTNGEEKEIPVEVLRNKTFGEYLDQQESNYGFNDLKPAEIRARAKEEESLIIEDLQQGLNPLYNIIYSKQGSDNKLRVIDSADNGIGATLYAAANKDISDSAKAGLIAFSPANTNQTEPGAWITTFNKDKTVNNRYFVTGVGTSEASNIIYGDRSFRINSNLQTIDKYHKNFNILSGVDMPYGGSISFGPGSQPGTFSARIGNRQTPNLGVENAQLLYEALLQYQDIYNKVDTGNIKNEQELENLNNSLNNRLIPFIAMCFNISVEEVDDKLDLSKNIR